jgi:hypothetical protein
MPPLHSLLLCLRLRSQWYNQVSSMVTNRDRKSFGSRRPKKFQICSDDWQADPRSGILGPTSRRVSHVQIFMCDVPNPLPWDAQFAQLLIQPKSGRRFSKISSWIWSIIPGVVTVLGLPWWGTSQVKKSPRLNLATQFLTVVYDVGY